MPQAIIPVLAGVIGSTAVASAIVYGSAMLGCATLKGGPR